MPIVGSIESLWRYPVKSMRGEEIEEAFLGFAGVYGDRIFAFHSSLEPAGFPLVTAREKPTLLQYRPRFRNPELALRPPNLTDAEAMGPGITPRYATLDELIVDVVSPSGETLAIDDPRLLAEIREGLKDSPELTLVRSERSMTDCRPISLFSIQTARQLTEEFGSEVDKRRFRANIYLDLEDAPGFAENAFVGRSLKIGAKAIVHIVERDPRCKLITLDPDTSESNPALLRPISQSHENYAGLYAAGIVEGMVKRGDPITTLD
jgi:uncharacterized protein YcbX